MESQLVDFYRGILLFLKNELKLFLVNFYLSDLISRVQFKTISFSSKAASHDNIWFCVSDSVRKVQFQTISFTFLHEVVFDLIFYNPPDISLHKKDDDIFFCYSSTHDTEIHIRCQNEFGGTSPFMSSFLLNNCALEEERQSQSHLIKFML